MIDERRCLDVQLAVGLSNSGVEVDGHVPARGVQLAAHLQRPAVERGALGDEPDLGVVGDVEELRRP